MLAVVILEFNGLLADSAAAGQLKFKLRGQHLHVDARRVESLEHRDFLAVSALVDANRDLLGFPRSGFARALGSTHTNQYLSRMDYG